MLTKRPIKQGCRELNNMTRRWQRIGIIMQNYRQFNAIYRYGVTIVN